MIGFVIGQNSGIYGIWQYFRHIPAGFARRMDFDWGWGWTDHAKHL